jgi:hypothetical protein
LEHDGPGRPPDYCKPCRDVVRYEKSRDRHRRYAQRKRLGLKVSTTRKRFRDYPEILPDDLTRFEMAAERLGLSWEEACVRAGLHKHWHSGVLTRFSIWGHASTHKSRYEKFQRFIQEHTAPSAEQAAG